MEEPLILERYRPLAELGVGGHGTVVLAFDTRMARRVAIKRLPLRPGSSRTGLAEARTAAMLNHLNIVTVYEWDTEGDEAFIVMEYIEGASLGALLNETECPLDIDQAAALLAAVSKAIVFAHDNGVLHLDIKPDNVLITRDGDVKVADFGVSALTDINGHARGIAGTIGYMPPEQLRGQDLDERTDQWSLAALAYEALTLAAPFDATTIEGSLFKIENADTPFPSEFEPDLPAGLDDVLLAALAPEPEERYATVADFSRVLLALLGNQEVGRGELASAIEDPAEAEEPDVMYGTLGLWDRLAARSGWFTRAWAAIACGWLTWAGSTPWEPSLIASRIAVGAVALVAILAPGLGLGLGLIAAIAGLAHESLLAGAAFAVPAALVWGTIGRHGHGDGLAFTGAPVLAMARGSLAAPLLTGYVHQPTAAAIASAAAALATMTASAITGGASPFLTVDLKLFTQPWSMAVMEGNLRTLVAPGTAVAIAAWAAAGAVSSLAASRGTRGWGSAGVALGAVALGAGYSIWGTLDSTVLTSAWAPDLGLALMVMVVVVALGAPTRGSD